MSVVPFGSCYRSMCELAAHTRAMYCNHAGYA